MQDVLGLKEADGFRMSFVRDDPIPVDKARDFDGKKYYTARELLGKSGGRVMDWKLIEHIQSAKDRGWPGIKPHEFANQTVAICGGGPSLAKPEQLRELRRGQMRGAKVFGINRTPDFLRTKGIKCWGAALLDPIPHVANYITPQIGTRYYIGSQCHPDVFDKFDRPGIEKYIFHARSNGAENAVLDDMELAHAVPSRTSTLGLRAVVLLYMLGFRYFHLFGFDSSYPTFVDTDGELKIVQKDGKPTLHAYDKPEAIHDVRTTKLIETNAAGEVVWEKDYFTNSAMMAQADEFQLLLSDLAHGIKIKAMDPIFMYVHGDGLIPDIASAPKYKLHFNMKRNRSHG